MTTIEAPFIAKVVDVDSAIGDAALYVLPNDSLAASHVRTETGLLKASVNAFMVQSNDTKPLVDVSNEGNESSGAETLAFNPVFSTFAILYCCSCHKLYLP